VALSSAAVRVVIPMKPLSQSKMRLAAVLSPERRAALSLWMLGRVGRAVTAARGVSAATLLGGDDRTRALGLRLGVQSASDEGLDLNAALNAFYRSAVSDGSSALLYLAGDLPRVRTAEIEELLRASESADLVLVPGARGGTNALVVRAGMDFTFDLGGQSFRRHQAQAAEKRLQTRSILCSGIEADVDLPEDLLQLEQSEPELWQQIAGSEQPRLI
jgi:2-phospho-L-lactate/phosphoenolpyruvate guanylyltransferase